MTLLNGIINYMLQQYSHIKSRYTRTRPAKPVGYQLTRKIKTIEGLIRKRRYSDAYTMNLQAKDHQDKTQP